MMTAKIHKSNCAFFRLHFWPSILIMSLFLLVGCTSLKINSHWKDRDISIDGENKNWLGAVYYIEDNNISAGVLNDEGFIYVCMIAEDLPLRAQIMRQGLTFWFDPELARRKHSGLGILWVCKTGQVKRCR